MSLSNWEEWTDTCCCPTGLRYPMEWGNRFVRPEMRARQVVVFPTCWEVAAT